MRAHPDIYQPGRADPRRMPDDKPKIKKRKYSRKGCKECKRRKIKCDEASPSCHNCSRLHKVCVYETAARFKVGDGTSNDSGMERSELLAALKFGGAPGQLHFELPEYPPFPSHNNISGHNISGPNNANGTGDALLEKITPPQSAAEFSPTPEMQHLFDEASVLVHEINHIIGPDISDLLTSHYAPAKPAEMFGESMFVHDLHSDAYVSPSGINEQLLLSNSQLIQHCIVENALTGVHIDYLRTLTSTELSYHLFPFASLIETNEVVRLLLSYLRKCPYLLTSLLAISATFQFNQTGEPAHDHARQQYTLACFKALGDAFAENAGFSNAASLSSNIEKLLLTILVLTSYFTATTSLLTDNFVTSWRVHLKGARDLLLNYSNSKVHHERHMSGGLALAKCWFFAIEHAAQTNTSMGKKAGAVQQQVHTHDIYAAEPPLPTNHEYGPFIDTGFCDDTNVSYRDALIRANLLILSDTMPNFNLYWGFSMATVKCLVTFLALTDAVRTRGLTTAPHRWTLHVASLIDAVVRELLVPEVELDTFRIPKRSPAHPHYQPAEHRQVLPASALVMDVDAAGREHYYSWFDACSQLHADSLTIKLCVTPWLLNLPRTHLHVQDILQKVFKGAFFFKDKALPRYAKEKDRIVVESDHYYLSLPMFDNRCIMIQSVFRLLAGLVTEDRDFERIELFFMGMVKLGNGSSLSALDVLAKFRESRRAKREELGDAVDDEIYDYYDRLNDIPFA